MTAPKITQGRSEVRTTRELAVGDEVFVTVDARRPNTFRPNDNDWGATRSITRLDWRSARYVDVTIAGGQSALVMPDQQWVVLLPAITCPRCGEPGGLRISIEAEISFEVLRRVETPAGGRIIARRYPDNTAEYDGVSVRCLECYAEDITLEELGATSWDETEGR